MPMYLVFGFQKEGRALQEPTLQRERKVAKRERK